MGGRCPRCSAVVARSPDGRLWAHVEPGGGPLCWATGLTVAEVETEQLSRMRALRALYER